MDQTPQPKEKDWLNGYRHKTLIYAVYKRCTLTKGHIQAENEGLEKDISFKWRPKKAGVAILISDKIDFEIKTM